MSNQLPIQRLLTIALLFPCLWQSQSAMSVEVHLRFNRDIRPILANHCYQCHGPDSQARQSGLRLDIREQALAPAESGGVAIVPERPDESLLIQRILSHDEAIAMPPAEINKPLTQQQKDLLTQWIKEGADYEPHWSYLAPERPARPAVQQQNWARNEIDFFVLARLERENLNPSLTAELTTLIRRLSLDLTGLPPTPADADAFVKEMTDAAQTDQGNSSSTSAPSTTSSFDDTYLRWVNHYLESPHYGERMAIDWLDAARFADTNGYQVDRDRQMFPWRDWVIEAFNTNMPFDQFTIEQIAGDLLPDATLSQKIATGFHRNHMLNEEGGIIPEEFLAEYCADRVETTATVWLGQTFNCTRCHDHKFDPFTQTDYYSLYAFFHNVTEKGIGDYGKDIRKNAPPFLNLATPEQEAMLASLQTQRTETQQSVTKIDAELKAEQPMWEQRLQESLAVAANLDSTNPENGENAESAVPVDIVTVLSKPENDRSEDEKRKLTAFHQSSHPERKTLTERIVSLTKQIEDTDKLMFTALVMEELPQPRETSILIRGVYSARGEVVTAATPACLPVMSADVPRNRLGLARWLVDPANPLTARVTVNRLWQSIFGVGLVRTSEDFGTQGETPSHPELLDWLADEFISSGWDVKHILRLIVSSATYRQSSRLTPVLHERDPENRLLARGPRFRLQAEFLRDQALAASGLLVTKTGGPSVKSYHPPGLYEQVTAGSGTNAYVEGSGDELYRRSMYSYWKRSVPNPAMLAFDAPFRETCTLRRTRTNTPLQALNLMNDPTYVEAARFLAGRMLTESKSDLTSQLVYGFRLVLSRSPEPAEIKVLTSAYDRSQNDFSSDPAAAMELLTIGARRSPEIIDSVRLAAMTVVASTILNLDEAVMKE
jgi:hypothetical protein